MPCPADRPPEEEAAKTRYRAGGPLRHDPGRDQSQDFVNAAGRPVIFETSFPLPDYFLLPIVSTDLHGGRFPALKIFGVFMGTFAVCVSLYADY